MEVRKRKDILETIYDVGATLDDALNIKEALDYDIVAKKTQVEELKDLKSAFELEVRELGNIRELSSRVSAKDKEIFFLNERIKNCEAEKLTVASSEKDMVFTLDASKRTLAQVESTKQDLWEKFQSLQEELSKATELKRRFELSENAKSVAMEKLRHMEAQLQSEITEHSSLKLNMGSVRETLEDIRRIREKKEWDYQTLEHSVATERTELANLKDEKRINIEKICSLQSQLDISTMTRGKLDNEIISSKEAIEALSSEKAHLKKKMLELEEKVRPSHEFISRIKDLETEKEQLLKNSMTLEEEVASQEVHKTTLEGDLRATKKALGELKFSQDGLKEKLDEVVKKAILARELELRVKKLEQENSDVISQANALNSQVRSLEAARSNMAGKLSITKDALEDAKEDKDRIEMRFSPLVEKENIVRELELGLARAMDDRQEALERIKALEDRLSDVVLEVKGEVKEETHKEREYEALRRENTSLKQEIESLEKSSKKGFEGLEYIKKSFAESEKTKETLESKLEGRKSMTVAFDQSLRESEALKKENADLKREIESLEKSSKKGFEGLEYIKKSFAESEKTKETLESKLEGRKSMTVAFDQSLRESEALKKENADLKKEIEVLKKDPRKSLDYIKNAMTIGDAGFKEHIQTLKDQLKKTEESRQALVEELESYKDEMKDEVETLKDENVRLKQSVRNGEGTGEVLEKSEQERAEFKKELSKTKRYVETLENQLKKTDESKQAFVEELESYKDEIKEEREALKDENARLKQSVHKGEGAGEGLEKSEQERAKLEKELKKFKGNIESLKEKNIQLLEKGTADEDIKAALENIEKENKGLRRQNDKFKEDIKDLENIKREKGSLFSALEDMKGENKELEKEMEKHKALSKENIKFKKTAVKYEETEQALERSEEQRVELKKQLDELEDGIELLREENRKLKRTVPGEGVKAALAVNQEEASRIKKELKKLEKKLGMAEKEISSLASENKDLKKQTVEPSGAGAAGELKEKLEKILSENDSLLARINELNSEIEDLKDESEDLRSSEGSGGENLQRVQKERDNLTEELSGVLSKLDAAQSGKDELVSKLDEAGEMIEELEEKLEDLEG